MSINIAPSQTENISTSGATSDAYINENEINNESNDNTIQDIIEIQDITEVQDTTENNFDKTFNTLRRCWTGLYTCLFLFVDNS